MTRPGDVIAEFTCENCGHVLKASAFSGAPTCPNCGGVMLKSAVHRRNLVAREAQLDARAKRMTAAKKWGIEPIEWKVISLSGTPGYGAGEIQNALDRMSDDGWEFVAFRVPNPQFTGTSLVMVFKRRIIGNSND